MPLEVALIAALAVLAAHWTWIALTPRALGSSTMPQRADARAVQPVKPHLFGVASGMAIASANANVRLVGLVSPERAIFALEGGKSKTVGVGETIVTGLVLSEVHPDHVLVNRDGALERFSLERRGRR